MAAVGAASSFETAKRPLARLVKARRSLAKSRAEQMGRKSAAAITNRSARAQIYENFRRFGARRPRVNFFGGTHDHAVAVFGSLLKATSARSHHARAGVSKRGADYRRARL